MTLHEAIELVLNEIGRPMTSSEVAKTINERNLYSRQDKLPVPASQISARINNYPKIFSREFGKIKLVQDDIVSQKLQRYKNEISYLQGASADPKIIIDALKDLENKSEEENEDLDTLKEPSATYFVEESISPLGDQKILKQTNQ